MKLAAALALLVSSTLYAQSPQVPHKIQFAGITLTIRDDARREIQKDVDMLTQSPKHFNVKVERAKTYFSIIEKVFEQERVPDDFKYLCIQESALISDAVSVSNAVGFWQFKDFTAIEMGLRVDKEIDERMNIEASSRAAAKYLKKNNFYFNNWVYALQAYQMGAGGVLNSVKDPESGSKHMEITSRTYWYVKKFLAHKIAYEEAVKGPGQIKVLPLVSQSKTSLPDLAKQFAVDEAELKAYNKWVKTDYIPGDRPYTVFIPTHGDNKQLNDAVAHATKPIEPATRVDAKPAVAKNETIYVNGILAMWAHSNETIPAFAKRARIDLSYFLKYNDLSISDQLITGNPYYLKKKKAKSPIAQHIAREDENLWSISQLYGVQLRKLKKYNNVASGKTRIKEGSVILLAGRKGTTPKIQMIEAPEVNPLETFDWGLHAGNKTSENRPVIVASDENNVQVSTSTDPSIVSEVSTDPTGKHIVGPGETLYSIGKRYNVGVMSIVEWNNLNLQEGIKVGQVLRITDSSANQQNQSLPEKPLTSEANEITYQVKSSDTLYSVARQFGVTIKALMDWNQKKDFSLTVGENLRILKTNN
jgi:membrane-bound lytic murein transglycosylase D